MLALFRAIVGDLLETETMVYEADGSVALELLDTINRAMRWRLRRVEN